MLGNYLRKVEDQAQGKLVAAFLVSVCWDTFEGCNSIEKWGLNLLLNRHLAHCLVDTFKTYKHLFDRFGFWLLFLLEDGHSKELDSDINVANVDSLGLAKLCMGSSQTEHGLKSTHSDWNSNILLIMLRCFHSQCTVE